MMWDFVANITDELIMGLDILHTYDASVDIGRQKLRLAEEERPGSRAWAFQPSSVKDHVIPPQ
jgi:hypothetical protein